MKTKPFFIIALLLLCFACVGPRKIKGTFLSDGINYPEPVLVFFSNGTYKDFHQSLQCVLSGRWEIKGDTVFTYPETVSGPGYSEINAVEYNPEEERVFLPQKLLIKSKNELIDKTNYKKPWEKETDTLLRNYFLNSDLSEGEGDDFIFKRDDNYQIKDVYLHKFKDRKSKWYLTD